MSSRTRRIIIGLAVASLLASIGPITAAVSGSSGNSGNRTLWSGNLGWFSGNIGTHSGNVGVRSGNLPGVGALSGNAGGWLGAGTERGAAAGFFGYGGGVWSGLFVDGRQYARVTGSSVVWASSYGRSAEESGWAYAYRCDPRCTVYVLDRSTMTFTLDPTLQRAHFTGVLRQWGGSGECWVSVSWRGGEPRTGHLLYGYQDANWIYESAWASAYRPATATTAGSPTMGACIGSRSTTGHAATYMGLNGATVVTRPLARLR